METQIMNWSMVGGQALWIVLMIFRAEILERFGVSFKEPGMTIVYAIISFVLSFGFALFVGAIVNIDYELFQKLKG